MAVLSLIPSFNSGELSPLIHLRSDLDKYRSGCRTLQNFHITPFGGVKRRAGFAYFGTALSRCRLFRFQTSTELGYIMEFGAGYVRWYLNGIVKSDGIDYQVATPYAAADLAQLQMVQINSVAYFTHPSFPPYKLSRIHNTLWQFVPVPFTYPPMLEENLDKGMVLTTSHMADSGNIWLTANVSIFSPSHIGSHFEVSHERGINQFDVSLEAISSNSGAASPVLIVQGGWNFTTAGTWTGTFLIQRSVNGGASWQNIRQFSSAADQNHSAGGTENSRVLMRLFWQHGGDGSSSPRATLEAVGAFIRGLVRVESVTSSMQAWVTVVQPVMAGPTSYWREGAWSAARGFPRTVAAHEQRLVYGGNFYRPSTVWASAVDDFENFKPGSVADSDAWTHAMACDQQNSIQWMISQKSLLIGTSGDEWVMSSSKSEGIITPTNVQARRHSGNGSEFLKARIINDSVLFVQRGGKKVRDMSFNLQSDGYVSSDLTMLAEHVTGEGIIDTAWQAQPVSILWCVTKGGNLLGLTYDKSQNIVGWSRHTTGSAQDGFESVAVRSTSGEADQVWVVVRRHINGADRRSIERLCSDGFFLEEPWSELFQPIDGIDLWDYGYKKYVVGDIRFYESMEVPWVNDYTMAYYCLVEHTTDDDTVHQSDTHFPTHGGDKWMRVIAWEEARLYYSSFFTAGSLSYRGGKIWLCLVGHPPNDANPETAPITGSEAATYWEEFALMPANPSRWSKANRYVASDEVALGWKKYTCTCLNDASVINRPGTGASWTYYWEVNQGSYSVGDLVSADGKNYICTEAHTPTPGTRPGTGEDWTDVWDVQPSDNLLFYVDAGVSLFNVTLSEMTGLDHLEGETVQILANGAVLAPRLVSAGKVTFDQPGDPSEFTSLSVGLAFDSILEPMALEIGLQNGTSVSRERRIYDLVIYFHQTSGGKVADRLSGPFDTLSFRSGDMIADNPVPLFTGAYFHKLESRHDTDASFVIKQDQPLPMSVLAVVPKWNVYGD